MPGLIYWIAGARTPDAAREALEAAPVAIAPITKDDKVGVHDSPGPPDGKRPGYAAAPVPPAPGRAATPLYRPEDQKWLKVPSPDDGPEIWVGFDTTAAPTPADLARPKQMRGHPVTLDDGNAWIVPILRLWIAQDGSPTYICTLMGKRELGEDGKWQRGMPSPDRTALWDYIDARPELVRKATDMLANRSVDATPDMPVFDDDIDTSMAVALLGINYHIGNIEAALLDLLAHSATGHIFNAAEDLPGFEVLIKKGLVPGEASSSLGNEAS